MQSRIHISSTAIRRVLLLLDIVRSVEVKNGLLSTFVRPAIRRRSAYCKRRRLLRICLEEIVGRLHETEAGDQTQKKKYLLIRSRNMKGGIGQQRIISCSEYGHLRPIFQKTVNDENEVRKRT